MIREMENLGDTRTLVECPKTSVKGVQPVKLSQPHVASSLRETPMKTSQVPNKVPSPHPRKVLIVQSPPLCNGSRQSSLRPQSVCSLASGPYNSGTISPSINGLHSTPRHTLAPLHKSVGSSRSNSPVPLNTTRNNSTTHKSQTPMSTVQSSASSIVPKSVSGRLTLLPIKNDPTAKSKETFSFSGIKPVTAQIHESHMQTQDKISPSGESPVHLSQACQKRHRAYEPCDISVKKTCNRSENQLMDTPKSTAGIQSNTSSEPSSDYPSTVPSGATGNQLFRGPLSHLNPSPKSKGSSCMSALPNFCTNQESPMGVRQAFIKLTPKSTVSLIEFRPDSDDGLLKEFTNQKNANSVKSSTLFSINNIEKDTGSSQQLEVTSCSSGHPQHKKSVLLPKKSGSADAVKRMHCSLTKTTSKPYSASRSCPRTKRRKKDAYLRRSLVLLNDIADLFTPDPFTYTVMPAHKSVNPKLNPNTNSASTEPCPSMTSSKPVTTSNSNVTGSTNLSKDNPDTRFQKDPPLSPCIYSPVVVLEQIDVETAVGQLNTETVRSTEKQMLNPNVTTSASNTIQKASPAHCSETPPQEEACEEYKQQMSVDPLDDELKEDMEFALGLDLSQSSNSSEEEEALFSFDEVLNRISHQCDAAEMRPPSPPSTHGHHSKSETQSLPSVKKPGFYKNNLDQILKEKKTNERTKVIEEELLTKCKEGLLKIAEYEKPEAIKLEEQEFLQRFSLTCDSIHEVPPGEKVFNLERFGHLFNHDTLQLQMCTSHLNESTQRALLTSNPAQLKMHICVGVFQEVFNSHLPCPSQVSLFLFKLMSVHNERVVSEKTLKALCDIALTAAYQKVKKQAQNFEVWVPTLTDIALVLMNMGAAFCILFPLENLQPSFTERDLMEKYFIGTDSSINKNQASFPEHNYNNILKYLSYCMTLCPRAYTDAELLLLLTVVNIVSLDTRLILQPSVDLYPLQYKILYNIRDWKAMLPRICLALCNLTKDHHNMCVLVQQLPHNLRRNSEVLHLRQHLSMSMISKLLDGRCTYRPRARVFKLRHLRSYLPLMRPSSLLKQMPNYSSENQTDIITLDQEAYYLCYSLLTLTNEACNFQPIFPANQKKEVQFLCSELNTHVKCDVRESVKWLYRSKVMDLVARMCTKWDIILQKTKPPDGNLYHYWEPLAGDMHNSQEEHEEDNNDNGEGTGPDAGNEEEINWPEDEDAYSEDEERDEGNFTMSKEMEDGTKSEKPDGAAAINIDLKWSTTRQNPGIPMSDVEAQDDGSGAGCEHSA